MLNTKPRRAPVSLLIFCYNPCLRDQDLQPFVANDGEDGDVPMTLLGADNPVQANNAPIHRHSHHMVYTTDASG